MTTAELRGKIFDRSQNCPNANTEIDCPFVRLGGLSRDTCKTVLAQMDRPQLLSLFELGPCKCSAALRKEMGLPE